MRVSQDEKDLSHQRIVAAAARLVRERGVEGAGVADIMAAAGLTHGGFYRHFDGKEALLTAAIAESFDQITLQLDAPAAALPPAAAVAAFEARYLSDDHVRHPGLGCPVAALAGDVARASSHSVRASFSAGVDRLVASLSRGLKGSEQKRRDQATRRLAMMAGAVMIARASDEATGRAVLAACRPTLR